MKTIYERALELVPNHSVIGLGSGRAARSFIQKLGEHVRSGRLNVSGVSTSDETTRCAIESGVPLVNLTSDVELALTVDGADEVDPQLNLIKGYGRAMTREKIVARASKQLVILVTEVKLVARLGTRGRLPVEVLPFALPVCQRILTSQGFLNVLWTVDGQPGVTDNGNYILDCKIGPIRDSGHLDYKLRSIPGIISTGLFVEMADVVLVGDEQTFQLTTERKRPRS